MLGSVLVFLFWLSVGAIFYTYLGYPMLLAFLARLWGDKGAESTDSQALPAMTLLIAAYNEEAVIAEKIHNSLALTYPKERLQLLIVTDGSSDRTPEIVAQYAAQGVELLHQPLRQGKMAAINRAMGYARGEIVVFSDANNLYSPETLVELAAPFRDPRVGAVSGAKRIQKGDGALGDSEGLYWKYESFIKAQESRLGSCTSAAGEILAIRRSLFVPAPKGVINDDFFLAMQVLRQGYNMAYTPRACSFERVSASARDELIRRTRINAGRYQAMAMAGQLLPWKRPLLIWQIFSHKFLRPLVPFFMILAAVSNGLLVFLAPADAGFWRLGWPFGVLFLALQALFYSSAWLGAFLQQRGGDRRGWLRVLYLPTFLTYSNLAALRGFWRFIRGEYSPLWERVRRR